MQCYFEPSDIGSSLAHHRIWSKPAASQTWLWGTAWTLRQCIRINRIRRPLAWANTWQVSMRVRQCKGRMKANIADAKGTWFTFSCQLYRVLCNGLKKHFLGPRQHDCLNHPQHAQSLFTHSHGYINTHLTKDMWHLNLIQILVSNNWHAIYPVRFEIYIRWMAELNQAQLAGLADKTRAKSKPERSPHCNLPGRFTTLSPAQDRIKKSEMV